MKAQRFGTGEPGFELGCWVLLIAAMFGCASRAQKIQFGDMHATAKKGHVVLVSDAVQVMAGTPQVVELRFRVDDGFHINSHDPKDDLLIPTVLKLDSAGGVKVVGEEYPKGIPFRLTVGSGPGSSELLDVYQDEFRVSVRLVALKGGSTLTGLLHYQACGGASCFPAKTLPVMIAVNGE